MKLLAQPKLGLGLRILPSRRVPIARGLHGGSIGPIFTIAAAPVEEDDDEEDDDVEVASTSSPAPSASAAPLEEDEYEEEIIEEIVEEAAPVAPAKPASAKQRASESSSPSSTAAIDTTPSNVRIEISQESIRVGVGVVATFLGATFAIAVFRYINKFRSAPETRKRQVNRNLKVIQMLADYLPAKRTELTPAVARSVASKTGFSKELVFRKYIWFALRERKFDPDLINDLLQLKAALGLTDVEVARALKERSERIAKKYGPIMTQTEGLTTKGVERKAALRAFFTKLLFLTEQVEALVTPEAVKEAEFEILRIFTCPLRDAEKMRIVSLYDMDMQRVEELAMTKSDEDTEEKQGPGNGTGPEGGATPEGPAGDAPKA